MGCLLSRAFSPRGALVRPGGLSPLGRVVMRQEGFGTYVAFTSELDEDELFCYNEVDGAAVDGPNWASVRRQLVKVSGIETVIAVPANVFSVETNDSIAGCTTVQLQIGGDDGPQPKRLLQIDAQSTKGGNLGLAVAHSVTNFLKQQPRRLVTMSTCSVGSTTLLLQLNVPVIAFRLQGGRCANQAKIQFINKVIVGIRVEAHLEVCEARLRPTIWPVVEEVSATCGHVLIENTAPLRGKPIDKVVSQLEARALQMKHRPASWQTLFVEVEHDLQKVPYVLDFDPAISGSFGPTASKDTLASSRGSKIGQEGTAHPLPVLLGGHSLAECKDHLERKDEIEHAPEDCCSTSQEPHEEPPSFDDHVTLAEAVDASSSSCSCNSHWWSGFQAREGWMGSWCQQSENQNQKQLFS